MRSRLLIACAWASLSAGATLVGLVAPADAQTCADQDNACRQRGHTATECKASTDRCLRTGRWIGPAGNEFPITKRK